MPHDLEDGYAHNTKLTLDDDLVKSVDKLVIAPVAPEVA